MDYYVINKQIPIIARTIFNNGKKYWIMQDLIGNIKTIEDEVFILEYEKIDYMFGFGTALEAIKLGHKLTRSVWNNEKVFLKLIDNIISIKCENGFLEWIPEQIDILGCDWYIL
jgi:hypothetical protein